MEIQEIKTIIERGDQKRPYLKPFASVKALDYLEGVLALTSFDDGQGGIHEIVPGDPEGKGAKSFNIQFEDIWADDTEEDEQ